jgi:hypothetical protein
MQHQNIIQQFTNQYSPYHGTGYYHNLSWATSFKLPTNTEHCGVIYKNPERGAPFICSDCLVTDVCLEVTFEGLDSSATPIDTTPTLFRVRIAFRQLPMLS